MGRKSVSCNGVEATLSSSEAGPRRHERRRPADDSEQMVIRRWGQAHWGQAPGPSPITWPCMHAGRRNSSWRGLDDCQRSIGKRPAPCFLVLYTVADVTVIAQGRRNPPAAAWSTATRRCRFTRRLARLDAMIGDLPAISVIVSDSRGRLPIAGNDPAEWDPQSASPRRRPAIIVGTCPGRG